MRAVYPPTSTSDLNFIAKFKNTASGAEQTYSSDGSGSIQGKIDIGNYIVTMDVSLISDGSPYARGIAYDNPVTIGSGKNQVKAYAYDVKNATPPVISVKPQGATYANGSTAAALTVTASVNDSGLISYQWYSNTANSVSGATAISGATSPSYMPTTATEGTVWYYVVVTNTSTGKPTTISTVPVSIVVGAKPDPDPGPGTGTVTDPFLVKDVASLQKVGSGTGGWSLSAHYKQTADIDLSSVPNWPPIGTGTLSLGSHNEYFTGSYDGNGKIISNLTIDAPTKNYQGLFGAISDSAVVKNVGVVNCTIIVSTSNLSIVGGVVGANTGTVQNCYSTGNASSKNAISNDGGGDYETDTNLVGGVVGMNQGIMQNCYATGNVSGYSVSGSSIVGGVVGHHQNPESQSSTFIATVQNCVALNPDLSRTGIGSIWIGRIVGQVGTDGTILANNYGHSDMKANGDKITWTDDSKIYHSADIISVNWGSQSWWATAGNWDSAAWDFTNV